jgi:hypothetical protein
MINKILEEGEKEFDELFKSRLYYIIRLYKKGQETCEKNLLEDILDWHTSQQHKLLQSIVEEEIKYWKDIFDNRPKDRVRIRHYRTKLR